MSEHELIAAGFTLSREGEFFRLTLALPGGDLVCCHVSKRALKVCKGEKT